MGSDVLDKIKKANKGDTIQITSPYNATITVNDFIRFNLSVDDVDDDWCKEHFNGKTKEEYLEYLKWSKQNSSILYIGNNIINQLENIVDVELPEGLVDSFVDNYIAYMESEVSQLHNLDGQYYLTLDDYLEQNLEQDYSDFRDDLETEMTEFLNKTLILEAIAADNNVSLDSDGLLNECYLNLFSTWTNNNISWSGDIDNPTFAYKKYNGDYLLGSVKAGIVWCIDNLNKIVK